MRRHIIALAVAACIATTGCTSTTPTETPAPTEMATSTAGATEAASTEPTVEETSPEESQTPGTGGTTEPTGTDSTGEDVDLATQTFSITPQQAIDKGLEKSGDGIVHSIELDWSRHHNAWVYELDILVGTTDHDIDVHADTGEILEHEQDDTDDKEQAINLDSPMTWETARDKALDAVQGRITSWKLEWDDKTASYEFDIEDPTGDETEVEVNVQTGAVTIDD